MGVFLVISLLVLLIEPPLAFGDGRLTMKTSHKSAYEGEQISFSGKLTDRNGYAVSGATIIIWETDDGRVQQIAETTTNARGEYRATTSAQYWDGTDNSVEVYAFSPTGSVKSVTISITIDKPYAGQNFGNNVKTKLVLSISEGSQAGTIIVYPELKTSSGQSITSNVIKIYANGNFVETVSANQWSNDILIGFGTFDIKSVFDTVKKGSTTYQGYWSQISDYTNHDLKKSTSTTTLRATTNTAQTSNDNLYKNTANKAKSSYWDMITILDNGIKQSENSLSGLDFENSDAKQKIDTAWDIRWISLDSLEKAKSKMNSGESYLKNGNYELAYNRMQEVDEYIESINSDLSAIATEIKNAKKLEHDHLERNKFCFLFWCQEVKKFDYVDLRVKDIEFEIQKISNKKENLRSDYEVFGLQKRSNEQLTIKQQALEAEQLAKQKKEQELAQKQLDLEAEQLAKEQKQRELAYKQEQLELEQIENDKKSILAKYSESPFIMGLTDGELTYYVQPLPSYASQSVRDKVEELASWMDGKTMYQGTKLKRVFENRLSDFSVNWVKDYQEEAIGRQVGDYLIIGLGKGNCYGDWMPFNAYTVYKIMWHEVGHALGYDHVSDPDNIMYKKGTGNKFDLEYKEKITLPERGWNQIHFCHGGTFFYEAKTNSEYDGFKVYVAPKDADPNEIVQHKASVYHDCSAYENTMKKVSRECTVPSGSFLLIYNPSSLGLGNPVYVDLEIYDRSPNKKPDFNFDESQMYFSEDYINYVKTLFQN